MKTQSEIVGRHWGERYVHSRLKEGGKGTGADRIAADIPDQLQDILPELPIAFIGVTDKEDRVWCIPLEKARGDNQPFRKIGNNIILPKPKAPHFLLESIHKSPQQAGALFVDFRTSRRFRVNGPLHVKEELLLEPQQAFRNCKKYVHKIDLKPSNHPKIPPSNSDIQKTLSSAASTLILKSEMFFLSSIGPDGHIDTSYRGGQRGFVKKAGNQLSWIDFPGNSYYMTLGNLVTDKRCGLTFIDWTNGDVLFMFGKAKIIWKPEETNMRQISFHAEEIKYSKNYIAHRGRLIQVGQAIDNMPKFKA